MICPSCGIKNNYYHKYCFNCGTKLIDDGNEKLSAEKEDEWNYSDFEYMPYTWNNEPDEPHDTNVSDEPDDSDDNLLEIWDAELDESVNEPDEPADELHEQIDRPEETQGNASESDVKDDSSDWYAQYEAWKSSFEPEDDIYSDYLFSEDEESELDIQSQLPLRRYKKSERKRETPKKFFKAFIAVILIFLIGFIFYRGYVELIQKAAGNKPEVMNIDMEYWVEEVNQDGQTGRKILVKSALGEQIKIMDKVAPIVGGQAQIIFMDNEFDLTDYEQSDGYLQVTLPVTVMADGYPSRTEEIHFEIPVHFAPLELISPKEKEAVVEGGTYQLMLKVLPGSSVFINGNNYSHVVDEEGLLTVQLELPDQPEIKYEIHVSANGYEDTYDNVVFRRKQMEIPLTIDQEIPIEASAGTWVEITGNTHPNAKLSANLEVRDSIMIDSETGKFTMYVKAPNKGYTPLRLTAELEGKEDSVLEAVIYRPVSENEYTHSAWAFDYDNLRAHPDMHNGIAFVFSGTITQVQSTGLKTILMVNTAEQGQNEKLVYVEYWGTVSASPGQKLRIFGNHWGNKDDYPFIIASYIYR